MNKQRTDHKQGTDHGFRCRSGIYPALVSSDVSLAINVRAGLLAGLLLLITACAGAPQERPVQTISVATIKAEPTALPKIGYVSTGQPDAATLRIIKDAGYVAVIDLRTAKEPRGYDEAEAASALGIDYRSLPIGGPDDVTFENAAALERILATYDGPVLLHCASGNRVGALFALSAKANGANDEEAMERGRAAGLTRYAGTVETRLADYDP